MILSARHKMQRLRSGVKEVGLTSSFLQRSRTYFGEAEDNMLHAGK
ncbi:Unknown protein sequence [Pseudomonas syringae pv. cilantro]|uniref:Uncharacterized protein n=1 Tax=Pseudomonas syringae pv. cilantro TaxID=81035 RepID=A0A0N1JPG7_PSESX|nr:Unknown protein sequence [Pseudomonas syringae pv. cilantro]